MDLDDAIKSRRSFREFSGKKAPWDKVLEAIEAALQAPAAVNSLPMKFIIIETQDKINKISDICQQEWISQSKLLVVVCSDDSSLEGLYHEKGTLYARQQAGAAIENFLLKITDLGLATCWVGSYQDELIKQLLKIPGHINIEAILPVGFPKKKPAKVKKPSLENSISWEEWGNNRKPTRIKEPDW